MRAMVAALLLVALAVVAAPAHALEQRTDAQTCAMCHSGVVESRKLVKDVHRTLVCNDCHPGRGMPHETPELPPKLQALADRMATWKGGASPRALAACGRCHEEEVVAWIESAHGPAAAGEKAGLPPDCLTCHGDPHQMAPSFEAKQDTVVQCASCHAFSGEEGKPETNPHVVDTYRDTIHGRLLRLGNEKAAACIDCHGIHDVRSPEDPASRMFIDNRAETCAKCHEGATASFARAASHEPPTVDHALWAWLVSVFFSVLTFSTIGLLVIHVALDMFRAVRGGQSAHPRASAAAPVHRDDEVERFDIHARMQHWGMMISFSTLVITGWPLKTAAVGQSSLLMDALGGAAVVGVIHRVAGAILIAVAIAHVAYILVGLRHKTLTLSMIPGARDARDFVGNVMFLLGLRKERPKFGRFTYYEKFDYWAVFWGMLIMGVSGVMLWFPVAAASILPGEVLELARIAHSDEAMLAALAIFLWHFYNVHLRPTIFPMSWVWITGRISAEALYHEHREEYEARYGTAPPVDLHAPGPWHRRAAWSLVGLLAVFGVGTGVAVADMGVLKERIEALVQPPDPPKTTTVPRLAVEAPEMAAVNRPEEPFTDCLNCHSKRTFEKGPRFPHFDHFDDYFDGEIDDPKCSMCHEEAWHDTRPVKVTVCEDCHSKSGIAKFLARDRPDEPDEPEDAQQPAGDVDWGDDEGGAGDKPASDAGDVDWGDEGDGAEKKPAGEDDVDWGDDAGSAGDKPAGDDEVDWGDDAEPEKPAGDAPPKDKPGEDKPASDTDEINWDE